MRTTITENGRQLLSKRQMQQSRRGSGRDRPRMPQVSRAERDCQDEGERRRQKNGNAVRERGREEDLVPGVNQR